MSKVWFITGSSRGLGRHLAEAVLESGHQLVATARKPEQLVDLKVKYKDQVRTVAVDVTDPAAVRSAVQTAIAAFGRLDVLVNNAGYGNIAAIEDITAEDLRVQMETNFYGVVNVTRAALPLLREQRSGHIIQISSIGVVYYIVERRFQLAAIRSALASMLSLVGMMHAWKFANSDTSLNIPLLDWLAGEPVAGGWENLVPAWPFAVAYAFIAGLLLFTHRFGIPAKTNGL